MTTLLTAEPQLYVRDVGVAAEFYTRKLGFSVAFSLATALFGGFTPAICTYLIAVTGNKAIPGVWLSFAAALGLIAVLLLARRTKTAP